VPEEPISHRIAKRLLPATEQAREFSHTYRRMTPLLGQSTTNFRAMVEHTERIAKEMTDLAQKGKAVLGDFEAVYGYTQEGLEIAEQHADEVVQITTLMTNLDVFLEGDPGMLEHVMSTADVPILKEALGHLDSDLLVKLQAAINEAVEDYKGD